MNKFEELSKILIRYEAAVRNFNLNDDESEIIELTDARGALMVFLLSGRTDMSIADFILYGGQK